MCNIIKKIGKYLNYQMKNNALINNNEITFRFISQEVIHLRYSSVISNYCIAMIINVKDKILALNYQRKKVIFKIKYNPNITISYAYHNGKANKTKVSTTLINIINEMI